MTIVVPTVLVVDEDRTFARFVAEECQERGFSATFASSEAEVADHIDERVDVVVIDLEWRHSSGMELIAAAKRAWPEAAIVVTTAFDYASARRAVAAGADGYLRKPFHLEDLLCSIEDLVSGRPARPRDVVGAARRGGRIR